MWVKPSQHAIAGRCLEQARKRANVTQVALAKRLGKSQSFVSAYESGQRRIDLLEFLLIMEAIPDDPKKVLEAIIQAEPFSRPTKKVRNAKK